MQGDIAGIVVMMCEFHSRAPWLYLPISGFRITYRLLYRCYTPQYLKQSAALYSVMLTWR